MIDFIRTDETIILLITQRPINLQAFRGVFFAVTCAKSYSLLFNPAEVGGEFHVYTLNAGSESWIRVG